MKKLAVLLMVFMIAGFAGDLSAQKKGRDIVCFKSNMDCADCEATLYEHLRFEKGVKDLKVDYASNTIFIEYKSNKNNDKSIAESIEKKGFKAEKISQEEYKKIVAQTEKHGHDHSQEAHRERE